MNNLLTALTNPDIIINTFSKTTLKNLSTSLFEKDIRWLASEHQIEDIKIRDSANTKH